MLYIGRMAPRLQFIVLQIDFALDMFQRVARVAVMMVAIVIFIVGGGDEGIGDHHGPADGRGVHPKLARSSTHAAATSQGQDQGYVIPVEGVHIVPIHAELQNGFAGLSVPLCARAVYHGFHHLPLSRKG